MKLQSKEYIITGLVGLSLLVGLYYMYVLGATRFENEYVVEDGLIEYGTALFLAAIGLYNLVKFFKYRSQHALFWCIGTLGFFIIFLFGAGEEVSWGQRLLGFETPDSLKEINKQDEVNLHNIRIGDFDVNKFIFSQLLTAVLIFYFAIFPFLYRKINWIKNLTDSFGVPVAQWHHTIIFLIGTGVALVISSEKKWELHEFVFAAVFFMIFTNPYNKDKIN